MANYKVWLDAARPRTLPASIAPALTGSALAWADKSFSWAVFIAAMLTSLALQIGANLANDYYDFRKGSDGPNRMGPTRATASGQILPQHMLMATMLVLAIALGTGSYLIYIGGIWFAILGICCLLAAVFYTAGPFALAYLGLGDIAVFLFFGIIGVNGTYYLHSNMLQWPVLLASLGIGALTVNILVVNNTRDRITDQLAKKKTLAVRFGKDFCLKQFTAMLALAFLCLFVPVLIHPGALLALFTLPLGIKLYRELKESEGPTLNQTLGRTGKMLFLYSLLFSIGVIL